MDMNTEDKVFPTPKFWFDDEYEVQRRDPDSVPYEPYEVHRSTALKEAVVRREAWGAKLPSRNDPPQDGLVENIVLTYTHTNPCGTPEQCEKTVRNLQDYHMMNGQADIPYSFVLGGDERIYSGRGWKTSVPVPPGHQLNPRRTIVIARVGQPTCGLVAYNRDFQKAFEIIHFCYEEDLGVKNIGLKAIYKNWNEYSTPMPKSTDEQ